jgi:CelD/BcsL family acetyltransferase involved in cellulose biosynthesis
MRSWMLSSTASGSTVQLGARLLRELAEIREIRSEWRELFRRCRASAFQSPEWLMPWIEVFSPGKIMLIELRCGARLVGVAPLLVYRRNSQPVVAFMGGGVSDYLDVLIDPDFEVAAPCKILQVIAAAAGSWTEVDLTDLPAHSCLLKLPFLKPWTGEHDCGSTLRLPRSSAELLHLFSKKQRANLRNAGSRLERAGGGQVELAKAENACEFLDDLFQLHGKRWQQRGEPGVLNHDPIRRFHTLAAGELVATGLEYLYRLRLRNRSIAVIYSLMANQTAFCYLQGFDPEFASLSPGTYLMFSAIEDARTRGIRQFDFLRGQESYKQHWRADSNPTFRIQIPRAELLNLIPERTTFPWRTA